jgi:plasmid maintenance system antidote protein VapI
MAKNSLTPKPEVLRVVMKENGMTHGQVSVRAGCHRSTITRLVAGERRMNPALADRVAKALGVRTDLIFSSPAEQSLEQREHTGGRARGRARVPVA